MEQVNLYVGAQIRRYRKNRQMTLQQLADRIHKSRERFLWILSR